MTTCPDCKGDGQEHLPACNAVVTCWRCNGTGMDKLLKEEPPMTIPPPTPEDLDINLEHSYENNSIILENKAHMKHVDVMYSRMANRIIRRCAAAEARATAAEQELENSQRGFMDSVKAIAVRHNDNAKLLDRIDAAKRDNQELRELVREASRCLIRGMTDEYYRDYIRRARALRVEV